MLKNVRRLYALGLNDSLSTYDAFKLQIVNRLTILCIGIVIVLVCVNLLFQNYVGIVIDLIAVTIVPVPVLYLNNKGRYNLATYIFLIGYHLTLIAGTYHTILEGRESGVEYLFIPGAIAIIILLKGIGQYISVLVNFIFLAVLSYIRMITNDGSILSEYVHLMTILVIAYFAVYYFLVNFKTQLFHALNKAEKLNMELIGKEEALRTSNNAKDRLFSIIAHDLRSPLALIQGLLQPAVLNSMDKNEYLLYSEKVRAKVEVLQSTMNGLLEWAQSQLGSLTVNPEIVDVNREIGTIIELFTETLSSKKIKLMDSINDQYNVYADKNQCIIILRNIIHNAIKFTPQEGQVMLSVQQDSTETCIYIKDSGAGIKGETRERILNSELVEATPGTAGEKGSGIGLSFCQELLRKNKGRLEVLDADPTGTVFKVYLPSPKEV